MRRSASEVIRELEARIAMLEGNRKLEASSERYRELMGDVKMVREAQRALSDIGKGMDVVNLNWLTIDDYASTMYSMTQYGSIASDLYDDINKISEAREAVERLAKNLNSVLKVIKEEAEDER
jgi:hypothetical protein